MVALGPVHGPLSTEELTIIIPVFNEERVLEPLVHTIQKELPAISAKTHIIIIENGSQDQTKKIAEKLAATQPNVSSISLPFASYGHAIKQGVRSARGKYVHLCNADLWDIAFLKKSIAILHSNRVQLVIGSKCMKGARDKRPFYRRFITITFNKLLAVLFGFQGTETHGLKTFLRSSLAPLVEQCLTDREIFDTELVLRSTKQGIAIQELPIEVEEVRPSRYTILRRVLPTLRDLILLKVRL